ncbi:MAG: ATP-dependent helicase, partial [bacterium]|nr:ATP-dependent helicase [bacterium]
AYLIVVRGIKPEEILGLTFTNQAAGYILDMVSNLLPDKVLIDMNIGTFHSTAMRILNEETFGNVNLQKLGYKKTPLYRVVVAHERILLLKRAIKEAGFDEKETPFSTVMDEISKAKINLLSPEDYEKKVTEKLHKNIAKIYKIYQEKLFKSNTGDPEDLVYLTVQLFNKSFEVKSYYTDLYKYIFIDDYHYANPAQYHMIKFLAEKTQNVTFTGAQERILYGIAPSWDNMALKFNEDYKNSTLLQFERERIDLERILVERRIVDEETIKEEGITFAENAEFRDFLTGKQVIRLIADDEFDQVTYITNKIIQAISEDKRKYAECMVVVRTNKQIEALKNGLSSMNIPYKVVGDKLLERPEILDILSFLRLVYFGDILKRNKDALTKDNISTADKDFLRLLKIPSVDLNYSSRVQVEKLKKEFPTQCLLETLQNEKGMESFEKRLPLEDKEKLGFILDLLIEIISSREEFGVGTLIEILMNESGYLEFLKNIGTKESLMKIKNIEIFDAYAYEFEENLKKKATTSDSLVAFIRDIEYNITQIKAQENAIKDAVTISTLHSSEGEEKPVEFFLL